MTEQERLMLEAIILNDGQCHLHVYHCAGCPIWRKCDKERLISGRREMAMETLVNLELDDMLGEKV